MRIMKKGGCWMLEFVVLGVSLSLVEILIHIVIDLCICIPICMHFCKRACRADAKKHRHEN